MLYEVITTFSAILVAIAFIDFDTMEIPNSLILSIIPLDVIAVFAFKNIHISERFIGFFAIRNNFV